jgi:tRNA(Ile)-lysidine synthase
VARVLTDVGVANGEHLVIAVSGGVDSMVLLDVLIRLQGRLGLRVHVAHVHHGLRGSAADRDAAFVVAEAAREGLGVTVSRLEPGSRGRGESVQIWAREARYRCLAAIADRVQASGTVVAHTQDDQAETVLLNLLRGTGPRGLAGIPVVRGRILRPLLSVSRAEVEAYAAARRLTFRTDASNASNAYLRNRIRHQLLPLLAKQYNPRIVASLAALAALARQDDDALTAQALSLFGKESGEGSLAPRLDVTALRSSPPAVIRRAFQEAFRLASQGRHGLTRRHLEALCLLLERKALVSLPGGLQGRRAGNAIEIGPPADVTSRSQPRRRRPAQASGENPLHVGVWTDWAPWKCRIRVRRLPAGATAPDGRNRWRQILSPRLLAVPLSLRGWRPGDRFRPVGLRGHKKLQDFFVDAKVPREERGRIPLLFAGGRLAWVVGHRIAEEFRWHGRGAACLVEVEFPEEPDERPSGPRPDHGA